VTGRIGTIAARLAALTALVAAAAPSPGQILEKEPPAAINGLEVTEQLGARVPLNLEFTDWQGNRVPLRQYFDRGKPVILVLGYYTCPLVCPLILETLTKSLNKLDYTAGRDFAVVYVSFDHRNTTADAAAARGASWLGYSREKTPDMDWGWAFHTSEPSQMRPLADAIGYEYRFLEESGEYSHPVALVFLSPDGQVSRYIYGFDYTERDLKLSLLEASSGGIAQSLGDRLVWFCYVYDHKTGRYSLAAFRVMQAGGFLTVAFVSVLILSLRWAERRKRARERSGTAGGEPGHPRPDAPGRDLVVAGSEA
jgi:protein SCO1/2